MDVFQVLSDPVRRSIVERLASEGEASAGQLAELGYTRFGISQTMTASLFGTIDRATGSVYLERLLSAPLLDVWEALTDPQRLEMWSAPVRDGAPGPDATFALG